MGDLLSWAILVIAVLTLIATIALIRQGSRNRQRPQIEVEWPIEHTEVQFDGNVLSVRVKVFNYGDSPAWDLQAENDSYDPSPGMEDYTRWPTCRRLSTEGEPWEVDVELYFWDWQIVSSRNWQSKTTEAGQKQVVPRSPTVTVSWRESRSKRSKRKSVKSTAPMTYM